jgi:hypothetical protein
METGERFLGRKVVEDGAGSDLGGDGDFAGVRARQPLSEKELSGGSPDRPFGGQLDLWVDSHERLRK